MNSYSNINIIMFVCFLGKLPEPVKAQAALKEFVKMLLEDEEMVDTLAKAVDCVIPCEHVQSAKVVITSSL